MAGRRRERRVTTDELALWRGAVRHARPLRPADPEPPPVAPPVEVPEAPPDAPPSRTRLTTGRPPVQRGPALDPDRPIDLDRRSWQRLRRGRMPIESRLDLHGDTQEVAHRRLLSFVADAQARGRRCILVVTGKGRSGGGILRHMVPRWLAEPGTRERIVAYTPARLEHGGGGALYVLLRRLRPGP